MSLVIATLCLVRENKNKKEYSGGKMIENKTHPLDYFPQTRRPEFVTSNNFKKIVLRAY